jgi:hypothetical protein
MKEYSARKTDTSTGLFYSFIRPRKKKNYFSCENFNDAKGLLKEKPSIDYQRMKNDLQEC